MKLYAPKYYNRFTCIADKCRHSCCIGWEIDIDNATLEKYNSLSNDYANTIRESIDYAEISHFILSRNDRCPHLDECGLCKIIKNIGDDFICDICREHPRFYNFTNRGKEVGLGMSCEEACRLILSSDDFNEMVIISEIEGEPEITQFDAIECVNQVYNVLKDRYIDFNEKLNRIYSAFDVCVDDADMIDLVSSLEYLEESHKSLFMQLNINKNTKNSDNELSRALAYFVYRHCSEANDLFEFKASLCFSIFCTKLIGNLSYDNDIYEIARIVSEEIEYSEENTDKIKLAYFQ